MFVLIYPFTSQIYCINNDIVSCKDLLIAKKIEMTFYSIMGSISHLGKMARTSAKSENPIRISLSHSFKSLIFCFVFGACVINLVVFFLCCRSYAIALQI